MGIGCNPVGVMWYYALTGLEKTGDSFFEGLHPSLVYYALSALDCPIVQIYFLQLRQLKRFRLPYAFFGVLQGATFVYRVVFKK